MTLPARLKPDHFKPKKRLVSHAHRDWVRSHYCSVPGCQLMPIEVAHVRIGTGGGMALRPSDGCTLSLCRDHHAQQHQIGERSFEKRHGFSMLAKAEEFYRSSPHRHKLDDPYV